MKLHIEDQYITLNEGGYIRIKFDVVGDEPVVVPMASEPVVEAPVAPEVVVEPVAETITE